MNQSLSVYTVIFLAIIFVTVSIWGADIVKASGDIRILLYALGAFTLKVMIDDSIHFQEFSIGSLKFDLYMSLLIYLFLAVSIANAAVGWSVLSTLAFAGVFAVGLVWLIYNKIKHTGETDTQKKGNNDRRNAWIGVNIICIFLLLWAAIYQPGPEYDGVQFSGATLPLLLLLVVIFVDFAFIGKGTLHRLASSHLSSVPWLDQQVECLAKQVERIKEESGVLSEEAQTSDDINRVKQISERLEILSNEAGDHQESVEVIESKIDHLKKKLDSLKGIQATVEVKKNCVDKALSKLEERPQE